MNLLIAIFSLLLIWEIFLIKLDDDSKKIINVYKPVTLTHRTLSTSRCLQRLNWDTHSVSHIKEQVSGCFPPVPIENIFMACGGIK